MFRDPASSCQKCFRFLKKTHFGDIYLNSAKNNNNYMQLPSLELADAPVRWWQISIIGIIIFLAGIDAFFWTPMFIGLLVPLFGIMALAVGVIMIVFSVSVKQDLIYRFPIFFAGTLSLVVAAIAIINSVLLIIVGCALPDAWKTRIVIVLFGMLTLFLSILIALFPALSNIALVKIWGIYAWVIGILCIVAGLAMKRLKTHPSETPTILPLP